MADLDIDVTAVGGNPGPTDVTIELTDRDKVPITGTRTDDKQIVLGYSGTTASDGTLTVSLEPNANISPPNSYYTVRIRNWSFLITKGASTEDLVDTFVASPSSLGLAARLGQLADVDVAGVTDGQALLYEDSTDTWVPGSGGGGVTDHGDLDGLADDDHSQYALADGTRGDFLPLTLTDNPTVVTTPAGGSVAIADSFGLTVLAVSQDGDTAARTVLSSGRVALGNGTDPTDAAVARTGVGTVDIEDTLTVDGTAVVLDDDARMTDSRTPEGDAGGVLDGTYPNPSFAAGAIVNADVNASAAIALSKLATDPLARANHTGTQAGSTVDAATDSARGTVELATTAEVQTGTSTSLAATPAGVAASTPNIVSVPLVSGRYHSSSSHNGTQALTSGVAHYQPVVFRRSATLDRTGVLLTTAAGSSAVRIGLYEDDDGLPGTLVADFGTVATTSGTGVREITISQAVTRTRYWACVVAQGGSPTVRSGGGVVLPYSLGDATAATFDTASFFYVYTQSGVSGALPTPAGTMTISTNQTPTVLWRAT